MQALYQAEVDQVSGGISDSEAREAVFQARFEGMIQARANGNPFPHHDIAIYGAVALVGLPVVLTAFYIFKESIYNGVKAVADTVMGIEFISCDKQGNCCCPA